MILDTCFFIDAQRKPESVRAVSERLSNNWLCTTAISCGELAVGLVNPTVEDISRLTLGVPILGVDEDAARVYGGIKRALRAKGLIIGENDLWISALALLYGLPVVTRNVSEFGRIPGIDLVQY